MQLVSYLNFNGTCEAAFRFYEGIFGGKIESMITHAELPPEYPVSAEWRGKIMHARMAVGEQLLMGSDAPPERYVKPQGFFVSIQLKDVGEAERVFAGLAEKGRVEMAIQETFWSSRFGMLTDQFGIPWMINCEPAKK